MGIMFIIYSSCCSGTAKAARKHGHKVNKAKEYVCTLQKIQREQSAQNTLASLGPTLAYSFLIHFIC